METDKEFSAGVMGLYNYFMAKLNNILKVK